MLDVIEPGVPWRELHALSVGSSVWGSAQFGRHAPEWKRADVSVHLHRRGVLGPVVFGWRRPGFSGRYLYLQVRREGQLAERLLEQGIRDLLHAGRLVVPSGPFSQA